MGNLCAYSPGHESILPEELEALSRLTTKFYAKVAECDVNKGATIALIEVFGYFADRFGALS
jgi:hypothetical protein